jgi:hypothetical protein
LRNLFFSFFCRPIAIFQHCHHSPVKWTPWDFTKLRFGKKNGLILIPKFETNFHPRTTCMNLFEYFGQQNWILRYFTDVKGHNSKLKFDQIWFYPWISAKAVSYNQLLEPILPKTTFQIIHIFVRFSYKYV